MGMGGGGGGRHAVQSDINVTPLVDVCLVLLIIFMVVTPLLQKGFPVQLPATDKAGKEPENDEQKLVTVECETPPKYYIGPLWFPKEDLQNEVDELCQRPPTTYLLIIFMVITPLLQMGYDVKVPPKATVDTPPPSLDQLIVSVTAQNKIYLNKEQLDAQSLSLRLSEILRNRRDKTVFFSADDAAT